MKKCFFICFSLVCIRCITASSEEIEVNRASLLKTTIGQLCKTSDFIAICRLSDIDNENMFHSILTFEIDEVVYGDLPDNSNKNIEVHYYSHHNPDINTIYLIFSTKKVFTVSEGISYYDQFKFDFNRDNSGKHMDEWHIVSERGIISIASKENLHNILNVITGYWKNLRETERDRDKYEHFLKGLLESDKNRVKSDAVLDFRLLIRFSDVDDLKRLGVDEELTFELRTYALEILDWRLGESD